MTPNVIKAKYSINYGAQRHKVNVNRPGILTSSFVKILPLGYLETNIQNKWRPMLHGRNCQIQVENYIA